MRNWWRRFADRVGGSQLPEGSAVELADEEHVLAVAGDHLVATSLGLWLPGDGAAPRRVGWHMISKAVWEKGVLTVVEAREVESSGGAVLLRDLPARRYALPAPNRMPQVVRERVTDSVRSSHRRERPGGGAWVVQRKVPGQDGVSLQVRA
ncbi:MAG: hypothetical protein ACRDQ5_27685, partial [Sciscionella sp.]